MSRRGRMSFVTDSHRNGKNNRVIRFTKDGKYVKEWGKKGSGRGEISEPHTIAMDSRGRLFVGRAASSSRKTTPSTVVRRQMLERHVRIR